MRLGRGVVVVAELDPTLGHEQHGVRSCVIVSDPDIISDQRFPIVCGANNGDSWPGTPLSAPRSALIDHLRSVDKRRIRRAFGELAPEEVAAIDDGLAVFLGLGDRLQGASAPPVQ